jgi:ribonuclease HI
MVRRSNPENEILIFTGSYLIEKTNQRAASAGCAVIYMPKSDGSGKNPECIGFKLEEHGPNGDFFNAKSMRADLRAVVAALGSRLWSSEGWEKVTIATGSNYVVDNITGHIEKLQAKGWWEGKAHNGAKIKNLDLWKRALDLVNEQESNGYEISFWHIDPDQNKQARAVAENMAKHGERSEHYNPCGDVGVIVLD